MENKLDKLFRDKLENHSIQPPANAWERIKPSVLAPEGLPARQAGVKRLWVLRIAATVALAGFIGWYAFYSSTRTELQVAEEKPTEKKQDEVKIDQNKLEVKATVKEETVSPDLQSGLNHAKVGITNPDQPGKSVESVPLAKLEKEEVVQEEKQSVVTVTSVEEVKETPVLVEPFAQPKQERTRVIVYSLASVEPKREVELAKTKGFKKMIAFAKEVKGGETTLASVRDWKDNFFGSEEQTKVDKQNNNN